MAAKDWIQTYSGDKFFPLRPWENRLKPRDVARALSMQCRYAGHVSRFYSVAEHSCRVADIVRTESDCWKLASAWERLTGRVLYCAECLTNIRWAFAHDWSEAFLGDVTRPLKHTPEMNGYRAVEKEVQAWIVFLLSLPPGEPAVVKEADTRILGTEAYQLKSPIHPDWGKTTATGELPKPIPGLRLGWSQRKAERKFLRLYQRLFVKTTVGRFP